jgi:hypothetical protein
VLAFAILDNHFHVILRNRPDVVATWSDEEVARRWLRFCPVRKTAAGEAEEPSAAEIAALTGMPRRLVEFRRRLPDISSLARLHIPLPWLHPRRFRRQRTTRGQSDWLGLPCRTLSFPTSIRSIPALSLAPFVPLAWHGCPRSHCRRLKFLP